ncbi:MAG: hypothetical protein PVJ86_00550 [Phycisphaerales bacterium]|jgi:hypothetical protein
MKNNAEQTTIIKSPKEGNPRNRLLIVTPTLGIVRMEWAMARYSQPTPCNWSASGASLGMGYTVPMNYLVADAQNLGCEDCLKKNFEWLLLWEDDVVAPPDAFLQLNKYLLSEEIPVVSGLYFIKGSYSEPILYRGQGNGPYLNFQIGDKVWADGVPTGFLLIHSKIIKLMWHESEEYETLGKRKTRKIFETPAKIYYDPITHSHASGTGTSDLVWCARVIKEKVLQRAGWPKIGRKKYPFLCDTRIFCKHIELTTGRQYP